MSDDSKMMSPAQRAFSAATATVRDDFVRALDRATEARRVFHAAKNQLDVAVAELRTFHGEINDEVAA